MAVVLPPRSIVRSLVTRGATVQIQIIDDGTRRAVRFALWERVHDALGDGTSDFYDLSRDAIADSKACEAPAVEIVRATLRDVERVRDAPVGGMVDLEVPEADLLHGLACCSSYIVEDKQFWSPDRRDARALVLATFDAAQLMLGAELEAVA
jgi:hypothetical protein